MTGSAHQRGAGVARKALLARKKKIARLAASLQSDEAGLEEGVRPDALDRASDSEAHEVLQRLQAVEAREIAEIDAALVRVRKGTYGKCEQCGGAIGALRLQAVPEARLCMTCSLRR